MKSQAKEQYAHYVLGNYGPPPLTFVRGEGVYLYDDAGRCYLDFGSGIAVTALGHSHPRWVAAVREQAGQLSHVSNLFANPQQGQLAARLVEKAGPGRAFFCNSGTEANEALLKLARLHGQRKAGQEGVCHKVICARNAFHGRTFGGMSATPQEKVQAGFAPLLDGFAFAELNDLDSFEALIDEHTAAIFIETIQGEGGVFRASDRFLKGLRALCDTHGLLLMLDEVQCGIGRSGSFFAFQQAGVQPDAIGMAKGLGGGFPIGAIWVTEAHTDLFRPGCHGSTFGGNPLASAAALAVLETIEAEDLIGQVQRQAPAWHAELQALVARHPAFLSEVRGLGYMVGLGLQVPSGPVMEAAREAGLLTVAAGNNTLRLLPPLTTKAEELSEAVGILEQVLLAMPSPQPSST